MIKNATFFLKIALVLCLLAYINFSEMTMYTNRVDATLTLLFSILFFYKSRKNLPVSLVAFFILYCNYSIVIAEYLVGGDLSIPIYEVKTLENYGISIRSLLLFISVIAVFYNGKKVDLSKFKLIPKDNIIIFYSLFLILIYILLFAIGRGDLVSYSVRVSPLYEYSSLLFLFAYYFSGKSKMRVFLITCLITLFILQDFYYGGRVTSVQLIFLFLVTIFIQKLSFKFILIGGFVGMLLQSLVSAYRASYSLDSINLINIFTDLKKGYFVFSTPIAAYYASATHVAAFQIAPLNIRLSSLFAFIISIFVGSKNELGNVTEYVTNHYFGSIGGGIIPTHFYFWLGWAGVILISIVLVLLMNKLGGLKNDFQKLCAITVILTVPRWYLYSPLSLFRPLILMSVLYIIFYVTNIILVGSASKNKIINFPKYNPQELQ